MAEDHRPDRTKAPKENDVMNLPRWARVAFAARCARRVRPLFTASRSDVSSEDVLAVDRALELAESSARLGRSADVHAHADAVVGISHAAAHSDAAKPASYASYAAYDVFYNATNAAYAAATAADAVRAAARAIAIHAMWFDLDLLTELAKMNAWTDDSPVDPDLCGPIWPFGKPKGWPEQTEDAKAIGGLKVTIELSDEVSDDEAERLITEYVDRLDDLHRALGGKGLRLIRPVDSLQPATVAQGVGS